jgi:hypothetical protein
MQRKREQGGGALFYLPVKGIVVPNDSWRELNNKGAELGQSPDMVGPYHYHLPSLTNESKLFDNVTNTIIDVPIWLMEKNELKYIKGEIKELTGRINFGETPITCLTANSVHFSSAMICSLVCDVKS